MSRTDKGQSALSSSWGGVGDIVGAAASSRAYVPCVFVRSASPSCFVGTVGSDGSVWSRSGAEGGGSVGGGVVSWENTSSSSVRGAEGPGAGCWPQRNAL